jgi:elongator complex protein 2
MLPYMWVTTSHFGRRSLDQTTRIHAETRTQDGSSTAWKEIARPQVHGYDIMGGAFLSALRFASIGDEKVVRVFDAPQSFVHVANSLCDINLETVRSLACIGC